MHCLDLHLKGTKTIGARTREHTEGQLGEPLVENGKGGRILAGRCIPEYAGWIPAAVIGVDRQA